MVTGSSLVSNAGSGNVSLTGLRLLFSRNIASRHGNILSMKFYYHSPEGIEILKLENGKVFTQRLGYCTIAEACETGSLVPTVFGREKLIRSIKRNFISGLTFTHSQQPVIF